MSTSFSTMSRTISGGVVTNDAVPDTIDWGAGSRTVATQSVELVEARVVCRDAAAVERAVFLLEVEVYREGGAAALGPAGVSTLFLDRTDVGIAATIVLTGNDLDVQVTGLAGVTLTWAATLSRRADGGGSTTVLGVDYQPTRFPGLREDSDVVTATPWTELSAALAGPPAGVTASGVTATGTTRERRLWLPAQLGGGAPVTYGLVQAVPAGAFRMAIRIGVRWPYGGNGTLNAPQGQHIAGLMYCQTNGDEARGCVLELVGSLTTAASQVRGRTITGSGAANNAINGAWTLNPAANNLTGGQVMTMGSTLYLERDGADLFSGWVGTADGPPCSLDQGFAAAAGAGWVGLVVQSPPAASRMGEVYLQSQLLDISAGYPWEVTL